VAINPVGRPIPTIPVKGVRGSYGPPKPVPLPPNKYGPPPSKYPSSYAPNKPPRRNYGPSFGGSNTLGGLKPPGYFGNGGSVGKPPFLSGKCLTQL